MRMRLWYVVALSFLLIVGFVNPPQSSASQSAAIGPELSQQMTEGNGPFEVIVTFYGDGAPTDAQSKLLKEIGVDTGLTLKSLPMAGVIATKDQINDLAANSMVQSIYLNEKLDYFNADATDITGVDKVRTDDSMRKANGGLPVTGKGIGVVVNDSGVDGTHKDHEFGENLVQNVLGSTNLNSLSPGLLPVTYQEDVANTDTNSGHGTHVAGTVGGTGAMSSGKYEGAAPGADLIGYGSGAALFVLDGIGGFDYALTHQSQYNIRVITNSWGSSGDFDPNHPINIASKKVYDRGIVVLFAAGNEGPSENTHNPYAKAPWVISVAAGEKDGTLADFSSRGTKGVGGSFEMDGETWTWEDRPTVTAPGVDIVSTRVIAPVSSLSAPQDAEELDPAHVPFYTHMSGTSMATPHAAGVVALMLEANPLLSPDEVKSIVQSTATNMPGYEAWEVGAGYLNAYAAVDSAFGNNEYGKTLTYNKEFNSTVDATTERKPFSVDYNPVTLASDNQYEFEVESGLTNLVAKVNAYGLLGETGNPVNLVLIAPDGTEYSSGISLLFTLTTDRTVSVNAPMAGSWKAEIRGLRGDDANPTSGVSVPDNIEGTLSFTKVSGFSGLNDIEGQPAASAIKNGVKEQLFDGDNKGNFKPDSKLQRKDLAQYLVMGAEIRQSGNKAFSDVTNELLPFASAVSAEGAAFRDGTHTQQGVMLSEDGKFAPKGNVTRAELAFSLVQSLGLEEEAKAFRDDVTVQYKDERVKVRDAVDIPEHLKGYVQLALDLNIINASFDVTQGQYDIEPTVVANFEPNTDVTRGDFAVAMTRYFEAFLK
ncbi:S8 family serine peptidase [Guptibacillus algicola]|uniref:S8 family serine peptidase n=1 Tax=Guptibacillus algicola TaxID=225844 RepID=UPI001CD4A05A|nr:S8 family serine peptidase [Alkalihalobacillus algicola]MCA0986522.1 S8 family serine peptidase [Alkalihalobacillus algicola]